MSSVLSGIRSFCKRATSTVIEKGNKNEMYTVTGTFPVSRPEVVRYRGSENLSTTPLECHGIPIKMIREGKMHIYFENISKKYGPLSSIKIMNKKCVVLNSLNSVTSLLNNRATDGRMSPFFQTHILKSGFSFGDFQASGQKQKKILYKVLSYNLRHGNDAIYDVFSDAIASLTEDSAVVNPDAIIRDCLSNMFTKLVSVKNNH